VTASRPNPAAIRPRCSATRWPRSQRVTIATTVDDAGRWWGFTATSFCAVSMHPPLVLVCLADTAECHPAFVAAQPWIVT
jgi:flavin reductase (DIM6/NTAB) family NADH-FMN oxidoreductase RutF